MRIVSGICSGRAAPARKATWYQSFLRYARAANREVSDPELLDRLARALEDIQ